MVNQAAASNMIKLPSKAPKSDTVFTGFVVVSPGLAKRWLGVNSNNRPMNVGRVRHYHGIISRGEWDQDCLPGITLQGKDWQHPDKLLNGQHRLQAIIETGTAVRIHIQVVKSDRVMRSMDQGFRRTAGNYLSMTGKANGTQLAAALTTLTRYDAGTLSGGHDPMTPDQIDDALAKYPGVEHWITGSSGIIPPSTLAALCYLFAQIDPVKAADFRDAVIHGDRNSTAAGLLHDQLVKKSKGVTTKKHVLIAKLIKAWNYYAKGRMPAASALSLNPSEDMPIVNGRPPVKS